MRRFSRTTSASVLFVVLIAFLPACKEESSEPDSSTGEVNPDKPNANGLIRAETIGGDPAKASTFYHIIESGDGGFYFQGSIDGHDVSGKLDQSGSVVWSRQETFIRAILRIPDGSGTMQNAVVVVGYDSVSADQRDAKVVVRGSDGTLIAETVFHDSSKSKWFNGIALLSSTSLAYEFVAGGAYNLRTAWPFFPYAARFTISSTGTLTKGNERFFPTMTGRLFNGLVADTLAGTRYLYAAGNYRTIDSTVQYPVATRLSDSLNVIWDTGLIPAGNLRAVRVIGPVVLSNATLIVEAAVESSTKPRPSGGGYWSDGFIAAVGLNGAILWTKTIALSVHSEYLYGSVISGGALYAVGRSHAYAKLSSNELFGYGWLVKIVLATGAVEWNLMAGSDQYDSGFNSVIIRDGKAYCAGWTKRESNASGGFQDWFVALDLSNLQSIP
jgi:hypothetical protein